jgi:hypothetical protein
MWAFYASHDDLVAASVADEIGKAGLRPARKSGPFSKRIELGGKA